MNQALAKREQGQIATEGSFTDARAATEALAMAVAHYNLISPATSVGSLPAGCELALSRMLVDTGRDGQSGDVYKTDGGKLGLGKTAIQKIGHAAGVSWDPRASGRVDNGSNPYYCRWRAVGRYKSFDGQTQTLLAEKELDLREGSPNANGLKPNQLQQMRTHIQAHCETKAQLRALRSLGIKTSYTAEELQKPFVTARVIFTGKTEDPELRREFAKQIARSFTESSQALYLPAEGTPMQDALPLLPPPRVGSVRDDDSGEFDTETGQRFTTPSGPANPAPASFGTREPAPANSAPAEKKPSGHVIPGGNNKGQPIEKAADRDLEYWSNRIGNDLEQGNSRDEARDRPLHAAMVAELNTRGY